MRTISLDRVRWLHELELERIARRDHAGELDDVLEQLVTRDIDTASEGENAPRTPLDDLLDEGRAALRVVVHADLQAENRVELPQGRSAQQDHFTELWGITDRLVAEYFDETPPSKQATARVAVIAGRAKLKGTKR